MTTISISDKSGLLLELTRNGTVQLPMNTASL